MRIMGVILVESRGRTARTRLARADRDARWVGAEGCEERVAWRWSKIACTRWDGEKV